MAYTYTYTISTDFPDGVVFEKELKKAIKDSSIATNIDGVNKTGTDTVEIVFDAQLSAGDKSDLDGDVTGPAGGLILTYAECIEVRTKPTTLKKGKLKKEINDSGQIGDRCKKVKEYSDTQVAIYFDDVLSSGDKTDLTALVAAHAPSEYDYDDNSIQAESTAPVVTHDITEGYEPNDHVVVGTDIYLCLDNTEGAAVWKPMGVADDVVTTTKIIDDAVTTPKILNDAITQAKIAPLAVDTPEIANSAIQTLQLDDNSVTLDKMTNDSVGTAEIIDAAVNSSKIGAGEVKLVNMDTNSVDSDQYVNASIDYEHLGCSVDEDDMVSNSNALVPTQQSVKAYVDTAVSKSVDFLGDYNADTNSPDLDTSPSGVKKGDMYRVSVAGTFFTIPVEIGDLLVAHIDGSNAENEWSIINKKLTDAALKAVYESNADTNAFTDAQQTKVNLLTVTGSTNLDTDFANATHTHVEADITDLVKFDWQGPWTSQDYTVDQLVSYAGETYICILNTTSSQNPTDVTYWDKMVEKGASGAGSTVTIEKDDVSVNATASTLNFEGSFTVTDGGSGKVNVKMDNYVNPSLTISGTVTAHTHNFDPSGFDSTTQVLKIDIDNNYDMTGIVKQADWQRILIKVTGVAGKAITFEPENANSDVANRFQGPAFGIKVGTYGEIIYDADDNRWSPIWVI